MLAIRMQRTGRKGHAQFRLIVQDKRFSPKSGRVSAFLGSYDPHTKKANVDTEKAAVYLKNGAQPTDRVAEILKAEGVKLPKWFQPATPQNRNIKNIEKLRRNRPAEPEQPAAEIPPEEPASVDQQEEEQTPDESEVATAEPSEKETVVKPAEATEPGPVEAPDKQTE